MISPGPEIRVNTTTASDQSYPSVAALSDGGYVVTWISYTGRLRLRYLCPAL